MIQSLYGCSVPMIWERKAAGIAALLQGFSSSKQPCSAKTGGKGFDSALTWRVNAPRAGLPPGRTPGAPGKSRGIRHAVAGNAVQPLMPDIAIACTIPFWKIANIKTIGTMLITATAIMRLYSV